jgi:Protein of unknown function (DUF1566)
MLAALLAGPGAVWRLAAAEPEDGASSPREAAPSTIPVTPDEPLAGEETAASTDGEEPSALSEGEEPAKALEGEASAESSEQPKLKIPKRLALQVPEALRPEVEVIFVADAASRLSSDGVELGILPANEKRRVRLRTGEHWIKAKSVDRPAAVWDRVVTVKEAGDQPIEIKMQKAIRDLERTDRHTAIYRAPKSDLMWTRRDNGKDVRWEQAVTYCEELTLGGYDDWRLPTLEELRSIRALWSNAPFKIVAQIGLTACCPWSADSEQEGEKAWNFNFVHRRPFLGHVDYSFNGRALCVRIATEEDEDPPAKVAPSEEASDSAAGEGFPSGSASHW